ncbi:MAG: MerR family transcriptional regulator [Bdellovibrionales bacterium]
MGVKTYGIEKVTRCLGVSRDELHQWVARDFFTPLHNPSRGKARRFVFDEIVYLAVCRHLRSIGFSLDDAFSLGMDVCEYKQDKCPRIIMSDEISILVDVEAIENKIRKRLSEQE